MTHKVSFSDNIKNIEEKPCVIEFQAFRGNKDEYVIKELVILDLLTYIVYPFIFKPPHPFKKLNSKAKITNKWLVKNFHNITWNEGFTDYSDLDDVMYHFGTEFNRIYTKGLEKRNWIQNYTTANVVDLKIDKDFPSCYNNICLASKNKAHRQGQCALKNVYRLALFLNKETNCSGGGSYGYKYGEHMYTAHHYYSNLVRETPETNNSDDGFSTVPPESS